LRLEDRMDENNSKECAKIPFKIPENFMSKVKGIAIPLMDARMTAIDEWLIDSLRENLNHHIIKDGNKEIHKLIFGDRQIGDILEVEIISEVEPRPSCEMRIRRIPLRKRDV